MVETIAVVETTGAVVEIVVEGETIVDLETTAVTTAEIDITAEKDREARIATDDTEATVEIVKDPNQILDTKETETLSKQTNVDVISVMVTTVTYFAGS